MSNIYRGIDVKHGRTARFGGGDGDTSGSVMTSRPVLRRMEGNFCEGMPSRMCGTRSRVCNTFIALLFSLLFCHNFYVINFKIPSVASSLFGCPRYDLRSFPF